MLGKEVANSMDMSERIRGGILGVVIGDALGLPVQFKPRSQVKKRPVKGMQGYGTFNLPPGTWSDDSSLTLCLAQSLAERGFFDPKDVSEKFQAWYFGGYMTPFGASFDVGGTTARAMHYLRQSGSNPLRAGGRSESDNGNGALMRILPATLFSLNLSDEDAIAMAQKAASMTHGHEISQLAVSIYTLMARRLLMGATKENAYQYAYQYNCWYDWKQQAWANNTLDEYRIFLSGAIGACKESQISSGGYVRDTLEAATWCLLNNDSFEDTVLAAVNLGDDSDTTAAVAGGLAGILYGIYSIPGKWIDALIKVDEVMDVVDGFEDVCISVHRGRGVLA
jgi:ADP-ribosylglycohydrolase